METKYFGQNSVNHIDESSMSNKIYEKDLFDTKSKEYNTSGGKQSFHGMMYQLKLIILFLCRALNAVDIYKFRLGSEMEAADKFDDIIFQYEKDGKIHYRFLQAKHKLSEESKKISIYELLMKQNGEFILTKYLSSYINIKHNFKFNLKTDVLEYLILCTNIGFKIGDRKDQLILTENIFDKKWDTFMETNLYQFKNRFPGRELIVSILREYVLETKISSEIVSCIFGDQPINLKKYKNGKGVPKFRQIIFNNVIDIRRKKFTYDFLNSKKLSREAKVFREALKNFFQKQQDEIKLKKTHFIESEDMEELVHDFSVLLLKYKSNIEIVLDESTVLIEKYLKLFLTCILVYQKDKIKFRSDFLENEILPNNLNEFRNKLICKIDKEIDLNHITFIIKQRNRYYKEIYTQESSFWNHLCDIHLNFCNINAIDNTIQNIDTDIEEFLCKLVFAVNQPNEEILDKKINKEIGECFKFGDIDLASNNTKLSVIEWFKNAKGIYLDYKDAKEFFEKTIIKISNIKLTGFAELFAMDMNKCGLYFKTKNNFVESFLCSNKKMLNIVNKDDTEFNALQVFQTLQDNINYKFKFVCLNIYTFIDNFHLILKALKLHNISLVLLKFRPIEYNYCRLYVLFSEILEEFNNMKIIIITTHLHLPLGRLLYEQFKTNYEEHFSCTKFNDLNEKSQEFLRQKCVIFQGREVVLRDINENFTRFIDDTEITCLIKNKILQIGRPLATLDDSEYFYIERQLYMPEKDIIKNVGTLKDINEPIVLITADPGMGKSTLLTRLAIQCQLLNSAVWYLRINLNDHAEKLSISNFDDLHEVLNFLHGAGGLETEFERQLFLKCFEVENKIVLLIDGVDEISPRYTKPVKKLLKQLQSFNKIQTWITSRPHLKNELETLLEIKSYMLTPFNCENRNIFFFKHWSSQIKSNEINKEIISNYVETFLNFVSIEFKDENNNFTSNPLQAKMLAVGFQDDFTKFYYSEDKNKEFTIKLNMLNLYETFVKTKFKIYMDEKVLQCSTVSANENIDLIYNTFFEKHEYVSLYVLFDESELEDFLSAEEKLTAKKFLSQIEEGQEKSGLIITGTDSIPRFVHRTFAEFFTANYFYKVILNKNVKNKIQLIRHKLLQPDFQVVCRFLDRLFVKDVDNTQEYEIHRAFLDDDIRKISELIKIKNVLNSQDKAGRTILHLSSFYDREDICKLILKYNPNQNIADEIFNWTPIRFICHNENYELMKLFLTEMIKSENVEEINIDNINYTLLASAKYGLFKYVRHLINNGCNINFRNCYGVSALHYAAKYGHFEIVQILVESNANIDRHDIFSKTALYLAIEGDFINIAEFLINNGADINIINEYSGTLLHIAAEYGHLNVVKFLVNNNVSIVVYNNKSLRALHVAASCGHFDIFEYLFNRDQQFSRNVCFKDSIHCAAENGHLNIVKYLVFKYKQVDIPDDYHWTPLHCAAWNGHIHVVKFLIKEGANVNEANSTGMTALHCAAHSGHLVVVKYLLSKHAQIDSVTNFFKQTPLHLAVLNGHSEVVKYLIKMRATVDVRTKYQHTPLIQVAAKGFNSLVKLFINVGAQLDEHYYNWTPLHYASRYGHLNVVQELILNNANINAHTQNYITPLYLAVQYQQTLVYEFLKSKNSSINAYPCTYNSSLLVASRNGDFEVAKYLIQNNAQLDARSYTGKTCLHYTAMFGFLELTKLFVSNNACIDAQDDFLNTPLHLAVSFVQIEIVKVLINNNASLNIRNHTKRTPLQIAKLGGNDELLELLVTKNEHIDEDNEKDNKSQLRALNFYKPDKISF